MISNRQYNLIKSQYQDVSSWAVWCSPNNSPKSNTNDMSWVNSKDLLSVLDTGYIFVGLNLSSTHGDKSNTGKYPWGNFHSGYAYQNDYKLRYALRGTRYWGSYITDLIKSYPEVDSSKVVKYIKTNPDVLLKNIIDFEKEISYLTNDSVLVAMGSKTFEYLSKYLGDKYRIVRIKHYSYRISKEKYRQEVLEILDSIS